MRSIRTFFILQILFCGSFLTAQNYEADILRFSSNHSGGTARFIALGGAFSSVGADMSSFSYNPAGVGMYRNSVAQISFGANYTKTKSEYFNQFDSDVKVNPVMPSVGVVFSTKLNGSQGVFRNVSLGLAFNRLGEYNARQKFSAFNQSPGSSISWNWANEMSDVYNGTYVDETSLEEVGFNTYTGFYGYLANYDSSFMNYTSPVVDSFQQTRYVDVKGGKNEFVISGGANYLDKLFFGASLGIPIVNYSRESRFIEEDVNDVAANTFFNEFELKEDYKTEGLGFNVKLGAIYKVNRWLRIGGGIQTPERISLTERFSSQLSSNMDFGSYDISTGEGVFEYKVRLPWRANVGASLFFNNKGFVSVDYEAVGYNSMRYIFENDFREVSDAINLNLQAKYKVAHNAKIGVESVINNLRLRVGYNYFGSPIKSTYQFENFNYSRHSVSGGFGVVVSKIAVDFAYQHAFSKQFEQAYSVENAYVSGIKSNVNQGLAVVTVSYKLK